MRVALVANEYPPEPHGGIGTFTHVYARALASAGHEVTVVGIAREASSRRDGDVDIVRLPQSRVRLAGGVLSRMEVARWLRARRFDIVEVPEFQGMLPFGVAGVPSVVRLHLSATTIARLLGNRENAVIRWAERRTLRSSRHWIGISAHSAALITQTFGLSATHLQVIPCPIDMSPLAQNARPRSQTVLFVGRVSERKGAIRLARSAVEFLRECGTSKLIFVGEEEASAGRPIRERILGVVGHELAPRVEFKGRLDRAAVREAMREAAVFAFPSSLETLGLVVAEAMAEGCAVVVPRGPPFDEFVRDGESGMCVPLEDPQSWAAAIIGLLRDRQRAERLGTCARKHIERSFSVSQCVARSVAFYREIIGGGAARESARR